MWYRMNTFQQKILGIFGMLLFSFLLISILVDSKLLKDSQETIAIAIIVGLIITIVIGLISFWKFVQSQ